jgi:hypothetical protein
MAGAVLAIGAILGAVGTVTQVVSAKKAAKAQKQAAQRESVRAEGAKRQTNVEAEQTRRRTLRERMIAQGQIANQGAVSGIGLGGTSGFQGATSSISSQFNSNIADINRSEGSSISMANAQSNINQSMNRAEQWNTISSFGKTLSDNSAGFAKSVQSIFK